MIQVGFSTQRKNPLSRVIRWISGSRASHCWILLDVPPLGGPFVLEASELGFRLTPYVTFRQQNETVALVTPAVSLAPGLLALGPRLGARYDALGLLGMAWVMLGRRCHFAWKNPWHSASALFCSEAVAQILIESHYPGSSDLTASESSPEDLLRLLEQPATRQA